MSPRVSVLQAILRQEYPLWFEYEALITRWLSVGGQLPPGDLVAGDAGVPLPGHPDYIPISKRLDALVGSLLDPHRVGSYVPALAVSYDGLAALRLAKSLQHGKSEDGPSGGRKSVSAGGHAPAGDVVDALSATIASTMSTSGGHAAHGLRPSASTPTTLKPTVDVGGARSRGVLTYDGGRGPASGGGNAVAVASSALPGVRSLGPAPSSSSFSATAGAVLFKGLGASSSTAPRPAAQLFRATTKLTRELIPDPIAVETRTFVRRNEALPVPTTEEEIEIGNSGQGGCRAGSTSPSRPCRCCVHCFAERCMTGVVHGCLFGFSGPWW